MNAIFAILSLCVGLPVAAWAEDLATRSGAAYAHIEVRQIEPDGLTIVHDGGTTKVLFPELPEEWQKRYGYDPQIAARYQRCMTAAQKRAQEKARTLQEQP